MRVTNLLACALSLLAAASVNAQGDSLVAGLEAFHRGDFTTAERELKKSADPRARTFLAITLAATSRCEQADAELRRSFDAAKSELQRLAGVALAQCRIVNSRWDDASAVIAKLKSQYPADADVLYMSARLYLRAWNDTIHQLYKTDLASFRVNQISGEILETQGQFTAAAAEYRKALEKNPDAVDLHFRLGRALLMSSHEPQALEAALKEFEAELTRNPRDSVAQYQCAQVLLAQEKPKDAAARLERALEFNPNFPEALIALGKLRLDEKRNDEAISMLSRAVNLLPLSEAAHYSLMLAYRNAGKMAEARREKAELDKLQKAPEGEFTDFLKKLGEKPPQQ